MLTTAVLGLLNRNQAFYATQMTQLVAYDDERAVLDRESEFRYSESDTVPTSNK